MSAYTDEDVVAGAMAMCEQDMRRCGVENHEGCVEWEDDSDQAAYMENARAVLEITAADIASRALHDAAQRYPSDGGLVTCRSVREWLTQRSIDVANGRI